MKGEQKGQIIIVVGTNDSGKTTFIKNHILKDRKRFLAYDVNREYGFDKLPGVDEFIQVCMKNKKIIAVFEEATGFFDHHTTRRTKHMLMNKSHNMNMYVLVFHSLRNVPVNILDFSDFIVLFDTKDNVEKVQAKFKYNPEIWHGFLEMRKRKEKGDKYNPVIIEL